MPIAGCPDDALRRWLAGLGPLTADFTQKSLKQWMRTTPVHRSFTLLQDPLARADAAFRTRVLSGARADTWTALDKAYGVALPDPGTPFDSDDDYRLALFGFLRFVKANLGGQTGQKVDAHWASQSAVLQGFTQFQTPDAVLREDRIAAGLAYLAGEVGHPYPAFVPDAVPAAPYETPELRAAAREAYARDCLAFGF